MTKRQTMVSNRKGMLYGSNLSGDNFAPKYQGKYDRIVVFAQSPYILHPNLRRNI
jgi:hypothetical protein